MRLSECQRITQGRLIQGDCEFTRLSTNTRDIRRGDLFVALRGERFDAHEFLAQAVAGGACGVVVEQPMAHADLPQLVVEDTTLALGAIAALRREQFQGRVIGITGSSGKTTVKGLLLGILAGVGKARATRGNLNNQIGVPLTLMEIEDDDDFAVIEMGTSSRGEIGYLTGLVKPNVALVNNVMAAHLAGFGDLAGIAQEKSQIYSQLSSEDWAVINLDDNFAPQFVEHTRHAKQIGYRLGEPAVDVPDVPEVIYARSVEEDVIGRPRFELVYGDAAESVQLAVPGSHNVRNALAAAACALVAGVSLEDAAAGLSRFRGEARRMQILAAATGTTLVDDSYNANPGSVRAAIDYLAARPQRRVLVLGDLAELGEGAREAHQAIGDYARRAGVEKLFTCGVLSQYAAEAFGVGAQHFEDQKALIEALQAALTSDAVVLVKGSRSSRMENVIAALSQAGESQ